ncbi:hypothetical protein OUZ56_015832 [Daphnia magna]|uniref:Uncharacterized protein n=1 Tax=Daphnia magna TaxID=35525 RepID=A0ABR0ANV6_9CRUS|nr:hypothetical protein OUZ56_015832 [Daphnia magna]
MAIPPRLIQCLTVDLEKEAAEEDTEHRGSSLKELDQRQGYARRISTPLMETAGRGLQHHCGRLSDVKVRRWGHQIITKDLMVSAGTIQEDYRTTWINAGATNRQGF